MAQTLSPGDVLVQHVGDVVAYVLERNAWGIPDGPCVIACTGALPQGTHEDLNIVMGDVTPEHVTCTLSGRTVGTRYAIGVSGGRSCGLRIVAEVMPPQDDEPVEPRVMTASSITQELARRHGGGGAP